MAPIPPMIAIDWGTTNFRAFRLDGHAVRDRIDTGPGILSVPPDGFPDALRAAIGPWLAAGETRILMSGMVGSRQGWHEAPYLPCPADPAALAGAVIAIPFKGAALRLVPGLSARDADNVPEVMRGEEVQILGSLAATGPNALVCLPGSHSKWVRLEAGRIAGFTTHFSGEAFAALRTHTILARLMTDAPHHPEAFRHGVARSGQRGGLLHHLFGIRAAGLFGELRPDQSASFLSGLLIGHEVRNALSSPCPATEEPGAGHAPPGEPAPGTTVHLIGTPALVALYAAAIAECGATPNTLDPDAAVTGLAEIAEHIQWT